MQATNNNNHNSLILTIQEPQVENDRKSYFSICLDMFKIAISMVLYLCDICGDVCSVFRYYNSGFYFYFLLTAIFVLFPGIFMTYCFNPKWFVKNEDDDKNLIPPVPKCVKIFCRIFCMWPLERYIETLQFGIESMRAKKIKDYPKMDRCHKQMLITDANTSYLRLVECFFETIPQVLLTFYYLANHGGDLFSIDGLWKVAPNIIPVFGLAWSLTKYERSKTEDENNCSSVILFLAYLPWIFGRVIVLSFTAVYYFPILSIIIVASPILCYQLKTSDQKFTFGRAGYYAIVAFIHIFVFFNERNELSVTPRFSQFLHLILIFIETVTYVLIVSTDGILDQTPAAPLHRLHSLTVLIGLCFLVLSLIPLAIYYYQDRLPCNNSTDADLILTDDDGEISKIVDQTDFESIQRISPVPLEVAIAEKKIN